MLRRGDILCCVGEGSKPGDAIVVRYGTPDNYELMLVDGGTTDTGETLVEHLRAQFGRKVVLAHVVLTHSDADHASGLREVLREISVRNVWMHIPWLLAPEAKHLFKRKNWTDGGLRAAIREEYDLIGEVVDLGAEAGCKFFYPFQGSQIGPFRVLSPTKYAYLHLLPQFDRTPEPDQDELERLNMWIGKSSTLGRAMDRVLAKAQKWVEEKWDRERLKDGGVTSASNETSVVLYGEFEGNRRLLLTGDAGVNALHWAADYADQSKLMLQKFSFVQIPHHGSRRNVGPTILNRLVGPIRAENAESDFAAFVSAPENDDTHPRKMVLNAFIRRGG